MKTIKLVLLSILWASMLPAMEDNQPPLKRVKLEEDAQVCDSHMDDQKQEDLRGNSGWFAYLPDEMLLKIAIPRIEQASSDEELQEAIKFIIPLKSTCKFWQSFLFDQNKEALKNKLKELGYSDIKEAIDKSASLFIIKALIYTGHDINKCRDNWLSVKCPLVAAVCNDRTDVINELINAGADIERTYIGKTPLYYSAQQGDIPSAILLIQNGANVDADIVGTTILHWVAKQGNSAMVDLLLQYGANVHAVNRHGQTPLHCACQTGDPETIRLLSEARNRSTSNNG